MIRGLLLIDLIIRIFLKKVQWIRWLETENPSCNTIYKSIRINCFKENGIFLKETEAIASNFSMWVEEWFNFTSISRWFLWCLIWGRYSMHWWYFTKKLNPKTHKYNYKLHVDVKHVLAPCWFDMIWMNDSEDNWNCFNSCILILHQPRFYKHEKKIMMNTRIKNIQAIHTFIPELPMLHQNIIFIIQWQGQKVQNGT